MNTRPSPPGSLHVDLTTRPTLQSRLQCLSLASCLLFVFANAAGCSVDTGNGAEEGVSQDEAAATRTLDPNAIKSLTCTDKSKTLDNHDINVALLAICGGIQGAIQHCQGNPTSSTGAFKDARFNIQPVKSGSTINVSKGRWEAGVFAARAKCGDSPFVGIVPLGTSSGDLRVELVPND